MALVEGVQFLERLGFADIVLWLLTFALVYGILTQIKIPQSNVARAIIGLVAAFFVLMSAPAQLIMVLSSLSSNLILLVIGLLVFVVFIELANVGKFIGEKVKNKEGKEQLVYDKDHPLRHHKAHPELAAGLLIIFAILIFVAAGGLNLLGLSVMLNSTTTMTLIVIGVIILAVYWLVNEKEEG
jgi:hypothetical protein